MKFNFVNMDANETAFFSRELTHIKSRTYDIVYPEFKATRYIPVSSEAGPGAEAIVYQQFDMVGMMKLISNYAADLPRSDVKGAEFTVAVKSYGGSYGYNIQEIRNAQMAGRSLSDRRAAAVRRAWDQTVNDVAWKADGTATYGGLYGLLFNPNVSKGAVITGAWTNGTTTPDQICKDVEKAFSQILLLTKGVEIPDTCLMPAEQYAWIATTHRSTASDVTILEWLKKVHPGVTFDWVNELDAVVNTAGNRPSGTAGAVDCLVVFKSSPEKLTLEIPQNFEQFPPQERGLEYIVPCHGRIAGVIVYYPLSVYILEGI